MDAISPLEDDEIQDHPPLAHTANDTGRGFAFSSVFKAVLQTLFMIGILVGSYLIAQKIIADKKEPKKRPVFKTIYTVETLKAKKSDHQPQFISYGQTLAARSVDLRALVSGEIVKVSANLRAGRQVSKGEALVQIDDFNYQGALLEAKANLEEAKARLTENQAQIRLEKSRLASAQEQFKFAEADFSRVVKLKKRGTSTQQQLEVRKLTMSQRKQAVALSQDTIAVQQARATQMQAAVDRLQWRVNQAERNVQSTILRAPFSGVIRSNSAEIGRAITANDVVVSLYAADEFEVRFTLTDAQYGRLQAKGNQFVGRAVKVVWSVGGQEFIYPGQVDRVGAEITSERGGVEVFARLLQTDPTITLRSGAFVEVHVPDQMFKNTISVPVSSLYGSNRIYTVVEGRLVENKVKIIAFDGENALIPTALNKGGLEEGADVLTTRITEVSAGLLVQTEAQAVAKQKAQQLKDQKREAAKFKKIAQHNGLSIEEFKQLPKDQRQQLIKAYPSDSKDPKAPKDSKN